MRKVEGTYLRRGKANKGSLTEYSGTHYCKVFFSCFFDIEGEKNKPVTIVDGINASKTTRSTYI